jgi:hypothetical protein
MAANRKLSGVLAGRVATEVERLGATSVVHFDDGSAMTVQTATDGPPGQGPPAEPALGRVVGVRQQGTILQLDFDNGSRLEMRTAESTSSVLVRARDHTLEYAD